MATVFRAETARLTARYTEKLALLVDSPAEAADDRLTLLFTCCHPALSHEAQVGSGTPIRGSGCTTRSR